MALRHTGSGTVHGAASPKRTSTSEIAARWVRRAIKSLLRRGPAFESLALRAAIETRGRVHSKFERNGDHFIVLDLAVFAPGRCLATIRHTAIFRIAPNAA